MVSMRSSIYVISLDCHEEVLVPTELVLTTSLVGGVVCSCASVVVAGAAFSFHATLIVIDCKRIVGVRNLTQDALPTCGNHRRCPVNIRKTNVLLRKTK